MAQTFTWRATGVSSEPLTDGMCALVNNSAGTVEITDVTLFKPSGGSGAALPGSIIVGYWSTYRISAFDGGEVITPDKHDTNSSSLPSQVTFTANPDSVTTTALLRTMRDTYNSPAAGGAILGSLPLQHIGFGGRYKLRASAHWQNAHDGTIVGLTLREGEGIAEVLDELPLYARSMTVDVMFMDVTSGAVYQAFMPHQAETPGCPGKALWSLYNASGSGVVLRILHVDHYETGDSSGTQVTGLRVVRLGAIALASSMNAHESSSGVEAHDSANSIPSGLHFWKGPFRFFPIGANNGGSFTWYSNPISTVDIGYQQAMGVLRQRIDRYVQVGPSLTGNGPMNREPQTLWTSKGSIGRLVIPPGSGIAVADGRAIVGNNYFSMYSVYDIAITFTYTPPAAATGGVSRSRIVGTV